MRAVSANNRERRRQPASIVLSQENKPSEQLQLAATAALYTAYTVSNELTRRSTDSEPSAAQNSLAQMTSILSAFTEDASAASQYPADKEFKRHEHGK
jgi:hypothetical protein